MAEPLIGREEELNAVRAFLSTRRDGPALVLLEGEAGIGKTTVWEAVLAAEGPRRQILRARPAEAETRSRSPVCPTCSGGNSTRPCPDCPRRNGARLK